MAARPGAAAGLKIDKSVIRLEIVFATVFGESDVFKHLDGSGRRGCSIKKPPEWEAVQQVFELTIERMKSPEVLLSHLRSPCWSRLWIGRSGQLKIRFEYLLSCMFQ